MRSLAFGPMPAAALPRGGAASAEREAAWRRFRSDSIDGGEIAFADRCGRPVLVADTASLCGYTPRPADLQALREGYGVRGLAVRAAPSDSVPEELGSDREVSGSRAPRHGLTLPMASITPVTGEGAHPFVRWPAAQEGIGPRRNLHKVPSGADGAAPGSRGLGREPDGPGDPGRRRGGAGVLTPVLIGSEIYRRSSYGPWHPLLIPRVSTVMDLARALGWLPAERYRTSPRARAAALAAWHRPGYVAALMAAEADQAVPEEVRRRHRIGTPSNPVFPEMFRRPATGVGGVLLAAELLRDGGAVHVPGGGTHHGMPDRANGFCYLNDPVFAVLALRARGAGRVAYVDLDAHHPDGVELAFRDDPAVLVLSLHEEGRWPGTGALAERGGSGQVWNLPVPRGFHDDDVARALDGIVLPAVAAFRPDAIVLQCGADGVLEDPQSRMALSNGAHVRALRALRPLSARLMLLGGGGYNPWSVGRLWTRLWGELVGERAEGRLPPAAEAVLRGLAWERRGGGRPVAPEPHWVATLEDPWRGGRPSEGVAERVARLRARLGPWA